MTEPISPDQMAVYKRTALAREQARQEASTRRRATARALAEKAAALLRGEYGATRVLLYGSTAHGLWFTADSDIDLAVEGIAAARFWRAWSAVNALDPAFEISLVDWEDATPALRAAIECEGIPL